MESRGRDEVTRGKGRPTIARRSCDQCRTRKIGCDRGSPCSNCTSARLNCTHSAVASNSNAPKQRVLISAQYEQKIDGIARDIDGIKDLLQDLRMRVAEARTEPDERPSVNDVVAAKASNGHTVSARCRNDLTCDSAHIIDFLRTVVNDRGSRLTDSKEDEVISSLRNLVQTLEDPDAFRDEPILETKIVVPQVKPSLPPLEAAVAVLKWAKDHATNTRIAWLSHILPLEKFTDICKKVYFAVDDYSQIDFILATGYLSYIFFEHVVVSGRKDYSEYCRLYRQNLHETLLQLPLLLPATMEVIAALALGAFNAIENSNATMAWTFTSTASDLCQRLGYHRSLPVIDGEKPLQSAKERLFWAVHRMDKGLSVRLGRPSNIRDSEITLSFDPDEPRFTRLAKLQGRVYDQLYSPIGLAGLDAERGLIASTLAVELRGLINETHVEVFDATATLWNDSANDPMRMVYLQSDLICQCSLLCLILRAMPSTNGTVSDECVAVAREVMEIHEECMLNVRGNTNDPLMMTRYINWAILHCPFVPFSVLFTYAVQHLDTTELARLDHFAASLRPGSPSLEALSHPCRLYKLLCDAARLYFETSTTSSLHDATWSSDITPSLDGFALEEYTIGAETTASEALEMSGEQSLSLSAWYYENQQMMNLLDENAFL